jgi:site-specific DNA-methyltransferase (adenine-specific)
VIPPVSQTVTTPYYQDSLVTIYLCDSRLILPTLHFDVVVTDPPYGMAYRSNSATVYRPEGDRMVRTSSPTDAIGGDDSPELRDWLLRTWHGPALVFGTWRVRRPPCRQLIVWDKGDSPGMGDLSLPWGPSHEEIYVIGEGFAGPRTGSVIRVQAYSATDADRPEHPTPKPPALMIKLLEKCPPEWVICDPFLGSGATLVAAKLLGRHAVGIEIEEKWAAEAARRCGQGVLGL